MPPYPVGSIVHLNSGSPELTVVGNEDERASVAWFSGLEIRSISIPWAALHAPAQHTGNAGIFVVKPGAKAN